ncbi:MAG TPA: hypothetical protein VFW11_15260 [Cyclobacteriaceae bacterium]|nr:hypothetical protein [Cyclobacteriaceae bacterium]
MYSHGLGLLFCLSLVTGQLVFGQSEVITPLFQSKEPLHLQASGSIKFIKKNTNDSTFNSGKFSYQNQSGEWIEMPVQTRVRGNFRLKHCYFPPLKLKLKKQSAKSTLFESNRALKLVVPCLNNSDKNILILKEYLCYQFYEALTPYHFNTRLANLELTETSKKDKSRKYELLCFFVEDNQLVAERTHSKLVKNLKVAPGAFDDLHAARHDFLQYMIGNADWSAVYQHNSNALFDKKYIPLSYDFDMSGFVNADYARNNAPQLGTGDIRERVYRGFCKPDNVMEQVRKEFLQLEPTFIKIIDDYASQFDDRNVKDMKEYLNQFFDILKDDAVFKYRILDNCRTDK